ncbi:cb2b557b-023b-4461-a44f-0eb6be1ab222 [Sclerotinia trifoliorum]|uniref:Cb2b557b-023b-4461-a44f-0eb6be1ab222 n=1 Tax=Sclerotinia trifoliorum TaxID=28548 RepID=A0A8H2VQJ4_9HELO|nr:cb2b557b-023b-4461-a44f-0eb6be1ab222 [Sclerotinia trifoliorum]
MSGIPRYNNAPLNARSGVSVPPTGPPTSSQTAAPASTSEPLSNHNPTTTSSSSSSYPRAHPAAAVPLPTGLSNSHRYAPPAAVVTTAKLQQTRTINADSDVPPAPQPAAFPKPTTGLAENRCALQLKTVPPPRAGSSAVDNDATTTMPHNKLTSAGQVGIEKNNSGYPPQMMIPPPSITRTPFSSTMTGDVVTAAKTMHPQPVSVREAYAPFTQQDKEGYGNGYGYGCERRTSEHMEHLEHPPGYVQNAYAAEMSSDQRRAMDIYEGQEGKGGAGAVGGGGDGGGEEEGIWESAKRWVGGAGSLLSEGEREVWRRINGK